MMALQLLPILQVIVILFSPATYSIPVYGTKRYGRSAGVHRAANPVWGSQIQPYQQLIRTQRYPFNYYDMYPYGQSYLDDYYYPQESISYPIYYPARTSKYEVYQAVLPYYYNERPVARPGYGYYGYGDAADPVVDLEEEMMQEAEREEREQSQPIGQEMYYENESPTNEDNFDDVSAAFLQNLIMSQMYNDAVDEKDHYEQNLPEYNEDAYGKFEDYPIEQKQEFDQEDEDVKELRQLANPRKGGKHAGKNKKPSDEDRLHLFHNSESKHPSRKHGNSRGAYNWEKRNLRTSTNEGREDQRMSFRDRNEKLSTSTTEEPTTTQSSQRNTRGQKEEVMMRPATPVRHAFSNQMLSMMPKDNPDRKRTPSVYDTIKHLLDMEKSLESNYGPDDIKPSMRKRIISSEDSLTQQLSVLKKAQ